MKVAFLTGEYPPMQGGIADHTACLAHHLARLGLSPAVVVGDRWRETVTQEAAAADYLPSGGLHVVTPGWGWRCWPGVMRFVRAHRPDVLHIQYQAAAFELGGWVNWLPWYLKLWRVPTRLVTTFHDLRVPYLFPKAGWLRWQAMRVLARYSDGVICTNREDLHTLERALDVAALPQAGRSRPLLTLIPLGSNGEVSPPPGFERTAWRRQYGVEADTVLLAYFGFLNESKGGEELVEALALLRQQGLDARLLLIGGEVGHADPTNVAYAERVQALIERHGLANVVYRTGYTDLAGVSANLLAADIVVMPYRDGVSFRRTTLIAALLHGRPVVSTHPSDPALLPEIEPGHNMLLAPPHNAVELARTIVPLAEDAALRRKLALGAEELGALFEWGHIAADTRALYERVLPRGPTTGGEAGPG